ncbi:hypothetical protein JCM3765_004575 [Sporobolomyces pararoseus]
MPKTYSHTQRSEPPTPYASTSSTGLKEWDLTPRISSPSGSTTHRGTPPTASSSSRELIRSEQDYKPVYSKYKQEILSEEEYISNLSEIIKRDFFPQLHYLDQTKEIVKGLESRDEKIIEQSVKKMREICTPIAGNRRNRRVNDTPGRTPFDSVYGDGDGGDTPTTFDRTPLTNFSSTPQPQPRPSSSSSSSSGYVKIDPSMSLDQFQSRYTSQDNSSFSNLLAKDNELRKDKTRWAWKAEKLANESQIRGRKARERLVDVTSQMIEQSKKTEEEGGGSGGGSGGGGGIWLLEGGKAGRPGERQVLVGKGIKLKDGDRERGLLMIGRDEKERLKITNGNQGDQKLILATTDPSSKDIKGKGKQVVLVTDEKAKQFVDWDRPAVEEEEMNKPIEKDQLQVGVESWPFKNRNSLMFPPDADTDPSDPPPLASTSNSSTTSGSGGSILPMGEPKGIRYHATRLMEVEKGGLFGSENENDTPSPTRSRINAAISGTPYPTSTSDASLTSSSTPRVNNFSFVSAIPSPRAHQLAPQALQELMTWGSIEATPITLRTTESDGSVGPFRIEDTSKREELAFKLARKAKKSLADSHSTHSSGLATSSSSSVRGGKRGVFDSVRSERGGGGNATPRTGDHLSPAARSLLSKTKPGRLLDRGLRGNQTELSREDKKREEERRLERARKRAREVESQDRLKRERWTPSPAVSLGFDPDLEDQRFLPKHGRVG